MDQFCRKGLGNSSDNKPVSRRKLQIFQEMQCMRKTLERNSSASLGMKSQEEQHTHLEHRA